MSDGPVRAHAPERRPASPPPVRAQAAPAHPLASLSHAVGNAAVIASLRGGDPIPPGTLRTIECTLGADLSRARVHTGSEAARLSRALDADAFTIGRHIFFGAGRYQPGTAAGERLLAHESAHVVQQRFREPSPDAAEPIVDSPSHEAQAHAASGAAARAHTDAGRLAPVRGIQRQPAQAAPAPTPAPGVAAPSDAPAAAPPVLFGFDMSTRPGTPYVSVTLPGHPLASVAAYLYGDANAAQALRTANGDVPDQLPPGRTLHFARAQLTPAAAHDFDAAIRSGTILRSIGMPQTASEFRVYRVNLGGGPIELTEDQFVASLRGGAMWVSFRAQMLQNTVEALLETQRYHDASSNSLVRWIADEAGGVSLPDESVYRTPIAAAQQLIDHIATMEITPASGPAIAALAPSLEALAGQVDAAEGAWHNYIEGTISGAEHTVHRLEVVRNVSFAAVAGMAGAVAAPAIFTLAGGGIVGGGLAIGGGAVTGGLLRGGLEVALPGAQADRPAGERFRSGFRSGAIQGGIGAAGALVAPAISAGISSRVFGVAPQALTGGSRIALNVMTGTAVGVPSGAASTAIEQFGAWRSGRLSTGDYLGQVGLGGAAGGVMGGAFAFLPIEGVYRTGGMRFNPFSGEAHTPLWMFGLPGGPRIQPVEAPPAFHALPEARVPLPEGYSWIRLNNRWMTIRAANVPEVPLRFVSYGPDPAGRFNFQLLSQGRLLGSSTTPRPDTDLFTGSRQWPVTTNDFADPVTGTRYGRGHIHDHADTLEGPGVQSSTVDPENYIPEVRWWNEYVRNPLVRYVIRPAGNGYREMAFYDTANPRFTANGTPIPDGVFFVETNPAGQPIRAWRIPFGFARVPGTYYQTLLNQFQIPLSQLPPVLRGTAPAIPVGGGGAASERRRSSSP